MITLSSLALVTSLVFAASPAVETGTAHAGDDFRTVKPTPGPEPVFAPPVVTRFTIPGTTIDGYLVERHELPVVQMTLSVDLGRAADPADKPGRTGLCVDLFDEGTKRLDKNALELAKADLGLSLSADNGSETSSVSLSVVKSRLAPAFVLFGELLTSPGLRDADLERLRSRHIASVIQSRASAESVGGRVFPRVFYGAGHAYGGVTTEASLKSVTRADCETVANAFRPDNARLFVSGDITVAELQKMFAAHLASFKGAAPKRPKIKAPKLAGATQYVFVDVPGAAQSRVMVAQLGPERSAADYAPTMIMAQILGGGFSSRINMNLREKNGYTYGARAGFSYTRNNGVLMTSSSIRTDATEPALREIAKELAGMGKPTEIELKREQQGALLAYPAQFATGDRTLGAASEIVFYGLSFDEWTKLPQQLRAVDAAAVEKAAKAHVTSGSTGGLIVLIAGDGKVVKPALEALAKDATFGKGSVVEIDADGNVKK